MGIAFVYSLLRSFLYLINKRYIKLEALLLLITAFTLNNLSLLSIKLILTE